MFACFFVLVDRTRPYLMTEVDENSTNYINATYVAVSYAFNNHSEIINLITNMIVQFILGMNNS